MIYLDSSVVLSELLIEDRRPRQTLWDGPLVSSRLLEYEIWNRLHARGLTTARGHSAQLILSQVTLYDVTEAHLERALHPFPVAVRTLDAIHLATAEYLRRQDRYVTFASYDLRLLAAAQALGIAIEPL